MKQDAHATMGGSLKRSLGMAYPENIDLPGTVDQPSPRPEALRLPPTSSFRWTYALVLAIGLGTARAQGDTATPAFQTAKAVWPAGRETEKNLFVGFRAVFECPPGETPTLRIAASSLYRIYLNGQFAGHGPARGPHGFHRVDEWPLDRCIAGKKNTLALEVAGYNVNSFYLLDEPAFLQAEVVSNGKVLAGHERAQVPPSKPRS